ncbi:MAG: hypothetical protein J7474_00715 [Arthrobacter sp.]|nr:hypothetical protein [Arthrobacter sp.]
MLTETREWRCSSSAQDVWRVIDAYGSSGLSAPTGRSKGYWCIESVEPGRSVLLRAGRLRQGRFWLELSLADLGNECVCRQRVIFLPRHDRSARLHWARLLPFRRRVLRCIGERLNRHLVHDPLAERPS